MTLKDWVAHIGGPNAAGKLIGVQGAAVRRWLRGEGGPWAKTIVAIVKASKGKVSYETVVKNTMK
jgi:DNA-binding transcriptional regulator YdaS (Cro superfamily)